VRKLFKQFAPQVVQLDMIPYANRATAGQGDIAALRSEPVAAGPDCPDESLNVARNGFDPMFGWQGADPESTIGA
jgi:hypothetical protein